MYESWHFRYIGVEHSVNFANSDLTFRRILGLVSQLTFDNGQLTIEDDYMAVLQKFFCKTVFYRVLYIVKLIKNIV